MTLYFKPDEDKKFSRKDIILELFASANEYSHTEKVTVKGQFFSSEIDYIRWNFGYSPDRKRNINKKHPMYSCCYYL